MATLKSCLEVLRLFTETKSTWTVPEIAFSLDTPTSTVYRTVADLVSARMLEPAVGATYVLGVAFIEFDRLVRVTDPLVRTGSGIISEVAAQAQVPCTVLLARLYGETVMCVADVKSDRGRSHSSYERGRPMPLARGATSKMILAQLQARRLNKLLTQSEAGRSTHAEGPLELRRELSLAKKSGYIITRGEVDKGLVGIAAPVSLAQSAMAASLSLVIPARHLTDAVEHRLTLLATTSARLLVDRLGRENGVVSGRTTPATVGLGA